ncbi:hypothetical protein FCM35_KLT17901 [Carex littledalei]|uniref:Uncharacterized protein n=1 Tax=Carex littledalei TaxID=544730 RepID=A0A833R942_9POAL|nr:hypothetical protein FCM35_KLT17901 [Carex littledalei]
MFCNSLQNPGLTLKNPTRSHEVKPLSKRPIRRWPSALISFNIFSILSNWMYPVFNVIVNCALRYRAPYISSICQLTKKKPFQRANKPKNVCFLCYISFEPRIHLLSLKSVALQKSKCAIGIHLNYFTILSSWAVKRKRAANFIYQEV